MSNNKENYGWKSFSIKISLGLLGLVVLGVLIGKASVFNFDYLDCRDSLSVCKEYNTDRLDCVYSYTGILGGEYYACQGYGKVRKNCVDVITTTPQESNISSCVRLYQ